MNLNKNKKELGDLRPAKCKDDFATLGQSDFGAPLKFYVS